MEAVKIGLESIPKLNISLADETEPMQVDDNSNTDWINNALAALINTRSTQIMVRVQNRKAQRQRFRSLLRTKHHSWN